MNSPLNSIITAGTHKASSIKVTEATKVIDVVRGLTSYHAQVDIYDPWIDVAEAEREYQVKPLTNKPQPGTYDAIILAVAHPEFLQMGAKAIHVFGKAGHVLYDVKSQLGKLEADGRL